MLATKLLSAMAGGGEKLYAEDVFSAFTYTGNGSTQTITNGIDLAGKGGMVWVKCRDNTNIHNVWDSTRGLSSFLETSSTGAEIAQGTTTFSSSGFTFGTGGSINNTSTVKYASWTFRKAPKFFDVVTWTGSGVDGQVISHSLGVTPGAIIIKRTDTSSGWATDFRHTSGRYHGLLNTTDACNNGSNPAAVTMTNGYTAYLDGTSFALYAGSTGRANVNASGGTYVAYLFAHDTGTDGIVQCGSFTTDGSGNATVSLGWEPQFSMWKASSGAGSWFMSDTLRGSTTDGAINYLIANTSGAEASGTGYKINATGFTVAGFGASVTHIYLAIRRPNKPPTTGTQVYSGALNNPTTGAGFLPDLFIACSTAGSVGNSKVSDRLRGSTAQLTSSTTAAEANFFGATALFSTVMTGVSTSGKISGASDVEWFFKRAPGVFDVVCYTGTGVAHTESHNLGVVPELMIVKSRSGTENWFVYSATTGNTYYLLLNGTNSSAGPSATVWNSTTPTQAVFSLGTAGPNTNAATYVAYLFASKAGISKVGSYTGNGTTNAIDCGFTTGARFILIKRTDSTGDWYVWDTVRGIIAGNDPHLSLNSTAAEVTSDDSIDPASSGFIVNQLAATNINVTGGAYVYLAFA